MLPSPCSHALTLLFKCHAFAHTPLNNARVAGASAWFSMSLLLPLHYERAQVAAAAGDFSKIMGENDVVFVDGDDMPIGATPLPLKVTKSLYIDATALSASATVNPGAKPLGAVVLGTLDADGRLQTSALASSGGRITLFPNPKHTEQLILPLTKEDDGSSLLPRGQTWVVGLVREKLADISGKNGSQLGHRTTHARRAFSLASSRSSAARASCLGGTVSLGSERMHVQARAALR